MGFLDALENKPQLLEVIPNTTRDTIRKLAQFDMKHDAIPEEYENQNNDLFWDEDWNDDMDDMTIGHHVIETPELEAPREKTCELCNEPSLDTSEFGISIYTDGSIDHRSGPLYIIKGVVPESITFEHVCTQCRIINGPRPNGPDLVMKSRNIISKHKHWTQKRTDLVNMLLEGTLDRDSIRESLQYID